jgi:hypothetical protein
MNASAAHIQKSSPAIVSSLPANSERLAAAPFSLNDQDRIARLVLSVVVGFFILAIGLLIFAGHLVFELVDLG